MHVATPQCAHTHYTCACTHHTPQHTTAHTHTDIHTRTHAHTHYSNAWCMVCPHSIPPGRVVKVLRAPNRLSVTVAGVNMFLPETRTLYSVFASNPVSVILVPKLDRT